MTRADILASVALLIALGNFAAVWWYFTRDMLVVGGLAREVDDKVVDERSQWFHRRASHLIEGIKEHHRPSGNLDRGELFGHCVTCMTAWPCPTARLVEPADEVLLRETVR